VVFLLNIFDLENWTVYSEYLDHVLVYGMCGILPMFTDKYNLNVEFNLRNALSHKRVVGLGEVGIDCTR
jgi:Tat protein secretion system quality control protein TatD with DNase activity